VVSLSNRKTPLLDFATFFAHRRESHAFYEQKDERTISQDEKCSRGEPDSAMRANFSKGMWNAAFTRLNDGSSQFDGEVILLNRPPGQTPEDPLVLQVQEVIAANERATFLERSRRGKRHAAQEGRVGLLCHVPYRPRSVHKQERGGEARFEIAFEDACVIQQVFAWGGQERRAINEVCRRLHRTGIHTQTGKKRWDHKTIGDRLKNPADKGEAASGKTRGNPVKPRLRAPRGRPVQSRRRYAGTDAPKDEGITISAPALVDAALFDAVQKPLEENR
jgi:site-specific DNA recombinase